jgi:hypothetical protein
MRRIFILKTDVTRNGEKCTVGSFTDNLYSIPNILSVIIKGVTPHSRGETRNVYRILKEKLHV